MREPSCLPCRRPPSSAVRRRRCPRPRRAESARAARASRSAARTCGRGRATTRSGRWRGRADARLHVGVQHPRAGAAQGERPLHPHRAPTRDAVPHVAFELESFARRERKVVRCLRARGDGRGQYARRDDGGGETTSGCTMHPGSLASPCRAVGTFPRRRGELPPLVGRRSAGRDERKGEVHGRAGAGRALDPDAARRAPRRCRARSAGPVLRRCRAARVRVVAW